MAKSLAKSWQGGSEHGSGCKVVEEKLEEREEEEKEVEDEEEEAEEENNCDKI